MKKWNLKDNKKTIYHHMLDEIFYSEDDIEILMKELLEAQSNGSLDVNKIYELFGEIDSDSMKEFWNNRAKTHSINESLTNLQDDKELLSLKIRLEEDKINDYVKLRKNMRLLDLGCGYGNWAFKFVNKCKHVDAVDYCKNLIDIGINYAKNNNIKNIKFYEDSIQEFISNNIYDIIFISGVLLYLNDSDLKKTIKNIKSYSKSGTILILRDAVGKNKRYIIDREYSEHLNSYYSAIYRTRDEFVSMFEKIGFRLVKDEDMFEENSPLNYHKETILRIFKFIKE